MCQSRSLSRKVKETMSLQEIRKELTKLISMSDQSKRFVGLVQLRQKIDEAITPSL